MNNKPKRIDSLPDRFSTYEEAAEFWDTHDTSDYPDDFETVPVTSELRRRRYEVEIDEDLMNVLAELAQQRGVAISELVSVMLREQIHPAASR
jgi:hypothetical protein